MVISTPNLAGRSLEAMPPRATNDAQKLTIDETAERLDVSRSTVLRLINDGELIPIDMATRGAPRRNLRVPIREIEKFERRRAVK